MIRYIFMRAPRKICLVKYGWLTPAETDIHLLSMFEQNVNIHQAAAAALGDISPVGNNSWQRVLSVSCSRPIEHSRHVHPLMHYLHHRRNFITLRFMHSRFPSGLFAFIYPSNIPLCHSPESFCSLVRTRIGFSTGHMPLNNIYSLMVNRLIHSRSESSALLAIREWLTLETKDDALQ